MAWRREGWCLSHVLNTLTLFLIHLGVDIIEIMEEDSKSITLILLSRAKRNSPWTQEERD